MNGEMHSIGFAVIGLGVGEQHARKIAALPHSHLRCLYDYDTTRARKLAETLGADIVAPSYDAILSDPEVQAVVLASFDDDHFAQVVEALDAGKHVFVEKPLCRAEDELRTIKHLWARQQGRLKLSSNLILRAAPLYRWLKDQNDAGALGHLYALDGEYLYGRLHKITQGWRKDVEGYSVMLGGGLHMIDLLLWLTGTCPVSVYAAGNRISSEGTAFRYDDFVAALLQFPDGAIGRITANFGCVHRHQHVLRLFGTAATFVYDDAGPRWQASRDPALKARKIELDPLPAHKGDLLPEFISAILSNCDWNAHTQTLFDGISVCIACDRAAQTREPVEVVYV